MNTKLFSIAMLFTLLLSKGFCQNVNSDYYRFGAQPAIIPSQLEGYNSNGGQLFFGVSDPGLDSATAITQAFKRAQALACMMKGVQVKNYTAGFLSEAYQGSGGTYQSMVELVVGQKFIPRILILDTAFTCLQEAILFVQLGENTDSVGFEFAVNRYNVEYQWGNYSEYSEQIEMHIDDKLSRPETLVFMKYGALEEVYTAVDDETFPLPKARYMYMASGDSVAQIYNYGLWINVLRELNLRLGSFSKLHSEQVKRLNETYIGADNLNEGLSKNLLSFDIRKIYFKEGKIDFDLDITVVQ